MSAKALTCADNAPVTAFMLCYGYLIRANPAWLRGFEKELDRARRLAKATRNTEHYRAEHRTKDHHGITKNA